MKYKYGLLPKIYPYSMIYFMIWQIKKPVARNQGYNASCVYSANIETSSLWAVM